MNQKENHLCLKHSSYGTSADVQNCLPQATGHQAGLLGLYSGGLYDAADPPQFHGCRTLCLDF